MKKLDVNQMENLDGGLTDPCSRVTGGILLIGISYKNLMFTCLCMIGLNNTLVI